MLVFVIHAACGWKIVATTLLQKHKILKRKKLPGKYYANKKVQITTAIFTDSFKGSGLLHECTQWRRTVVYEKLCHLSARCFVSKEDRSWLHYWGREWCLLQGLDQLVTEDINFSFYISIASKLAMCVCVWECDSEPVLIFTKAHCAYRTFKSFFSAHNNGEHNKQNTWKLLFCLKHEVSSKQFSGRGFFFFFNVFTQVLK